MFEDFYNMLIGKYWLGKASKKLPNVYLLAITRKNLLFVDADNPILCVAFTKQEFKEIKIITQEMINARKTSLAKFTQVLDEKDYVIFNRCS